MSDQIQSIFNFNQVYRTAAAAARALGPYRALSVVWYCLCEAIKSTRLFHFASGLEEMGAHSHEQQKNRVERKKRASEKQEQTRAESAACVVEGADGAAAGAISAASGGADWRRLSLTSKTRTHAN
jgi:hypothetical protein